MSEKTTIAIFQRDFRVGGIQKALLNTLDRLDYDRYAVDVYVFDSKPFYPLPVHEGLRYIVCRPWPFWTRFVDFDLLLRHGRIPELEPKPYDLAVDFNSYSSECAVGALRAAAKKRVMWIHNDMQIKYQSEKKYRILWHFFRKKFSRFDAFAAVSEGIIPGFRAMTGLNSAPVTAVPNAIDTDEIFRKAEEATDFAVDPGQYNLCSMGRLVHQKGFDLLLADFARVCQARTDMHLYLIGDGPERGALEAQIAELHLEEHVTLLGSLANPFPALRQMDGFALTSRYEGQGMVVMEGKALGLDLYISKNLEEYNQGIHCTDDIVQALLVADKKIKTRDSLEAYNNNITRQLNRIFGLDEGDRP